MSEQNAAPGKPVDKRHEAEGKAEIDIKLGPLEIKKLPRPSRRTLLIVLALIPVLAAVAAAGAYAFYVQPQLEEARDHMRRGEYAAASNAVGSFPSWLRTFPALAHVQQVAGYGSRLYKSPDIRLLEPELELLRKRYPRDPDVLLFEGLVAYNVELDEKKAVGYFTQAAERDRAHTEAHFLAAGRHIDLAYIALGQGDASLARSEANSAGTLIDRALGAAEFARDDPRYATVRADLYELQGDTAKAYEVHVRLAPKLPYSALQALFLSWRLDPDKLALSLENVATAVKLLQKTELNEGWTLRVGAGEIIAFHSREEKLCLLSWAAKISTDLKAGQGAPTVTDECGTPVMRGAPTAARDAARNAAKTLIHHAVCVEILNAHEATPLPDMRRERLEQWTRGPLACSPDYRALPSLPLLQPPQGSGLKTDTSR